MVCQYFLSLDVLFVCGKIFVRSSCSQTHCDSFYSSSDSVETESDRKYPPNKNTRTPSEARQSAKIFHRCIVCDHHRLYSKTKPLQSSLQLWKSRWECFFFCFFVFSILFFFYYYQRNYNNYKVKREGWEGRALGHGTGWDTHKIDGRCLETWHHPHDATNHRKEADVSSVCAVSEKWGIMC